MTIRTLSSREIYRNRWFSLREDAIERSNGTHGIYGVVDKPDGAVILPIDGDHIWLVEQFRYTVGERALELPQGAWASDNVDPETLARGELREETGLTAGRMTASANTSLSLKNWWQVRTSATRKRKTWRSSAYPSPL